MRRATKGNRDANEAEIFAVLEEHGWRVDRCSSEGFPDGLCTRIAGGSGQQRWVEVKMPGGRVQLAQARLWADWDVLGIKVWVIESADEARRMCQDIFTGHDWRRYPVDQRGRGTKRSRPKSWIPPRLRGKSLGAAVHEEMAKAPGTGKL